MSLGMVAQGFSPADMTQGYFLSLMGIKDLDDADDNVRQQLTTFAFQTPDDDINALGGLLSVAVAKGAAVPERSVLTQLRCDARPATLRKAWPLLAKRAEGMADADLSAVSQAEKYQLFAATERVAMLLGKNPVPYRQQADAAYKMLDDELWLEDQEHWAAFKDRDGLQRLHTQATVASLCAPILADASSSHQAFLASKCLDGLSSQPDEWLTIAQAHFRAGRADQGYQLLRRALQSQLYGGRSPVDSVLRAAPVLTQGLFGIQPDALHSRCVVRPGMPADWDSCSVRTPWLEYTCRREGREWVYDITQHFAQPLTIVLRQNIGLGECVEVTGTNKHRQTIRVKTPSPLPEVVFVSSYDEPEVTVPGLDEPTFERRFKPQRISSFFTDSIRYDVNPDFLLDGEYIVRGVPFHVALQGDNVAHVSYPDTLTIPLSGRYERCWLLLSGTTNDRERHISNAVIVAHYQDGSIDSLSLVNPDNWSPLAEGTARRLCLRLRADRKLAFLEVRPQSVGIRIGLMAVTLQ